MRRSAPWIVGLAWGAVALMLAAEVAADAVPPPPTCARWQQVRRRGSMHSGADCVPRTCRQSAQCGAGSECRSRRACFVTREVWASTGGPCMDRDGDGECDNRYRTTETVEAEPCDEHGRCTEGQCRTVRECSAPSAAR